MKIFFLSLLFFPIIIKGQNRLSEHLNAKTILEQANNLNHPESADRDFTQNPDSISLYFYTPDGNNTSNQRLIYNNENLLTQVNDYFFIGDSILEKYRFDYFYNNDEELILVKLFNIKSIPENYIGRYEYTHQNGRTVCSKTFLVQDDIFQGDSLDIQYDGNKIKSYRSLRSGITINEWYDNELLDSIVYENDKVIGYDRSIYQTDWDTIFTSRYRYNNVLFYNDNNYLFRKIDHVIRFDTAYYVSIFPEKNAAEGLLWELNFDRYRYNSTTGDFVLNQIKHAEFGEDSIFLRLENFQNPFYSDIIAAFDDKGKMKSYFLDGDHGRQLVNYNYAPSGRISKIETNNFDDFHRIYIYEYEFDGNDNITVYREELDDDLNGINTLYRETKFFYFTDLLQNKSQTLTLNIYPNPTGNCFKLPLAPKTNDFNLKIFDTNGVLMKNYDQFLDIYPTSDLSPGVYFIKSTIDNKIYYSKLVKL